MLVVNDSLQHDLLGHNRPGAVPGADTMQAGRPVLQQFVHLHDIFGGFFGAETVKLLHIFSHSGVLQLLQGGQRDEEACSSL